MAKKRPKEGDEESMIMVQAAELAAARSQVDILERRLREDEDMLRGINAVKFKVAVKACYFGPMSAQSAMAKIRELKGANFTNEFMQLGVWGV